MYKPGMKRTTIMLPPELKARAEREAGIRGVSLGELIRLSLEAALSHDRGEDPLFADKAVFRGDAPEDLSTDHDAYLYGGKE